MKIGEITLGEKAEKLLGYLDPDLSEFETCIVCGQHVDIDGERQGFILTNSLWVVAWCTDPACEKDRALASYCTLTDQWHRGTSIAAVVLNNLRTRMGENLSTETALSSTTGTVYFDADTVANTLAKSINDLRAEAAA